MNRQLLILLIFRVVPLEGFVQISEAVTVEYNRRGGPAGVCAMNGFVSSKPYLEMNPVTDQ